MTADPLSPDEGVRAALVAEVIEIIRAQPLFPDTHTGTRQQWVKDQLMEKVAALSTPVPEEGLPRGSASAVEGEPVAFDPFKGGCPQCHWLDTNLGRVLDRKCKLHQDIEDMQEDRGTDRQIIAGLDRTLKDICRIIGADAEDDPVAMAQARMDEIASLEEECEKAEAALAAERARADSLKAQLDEAVAQLKSHIATSEKASAFIRRQKEALDEANARLADLAKPEEQREWLPSTTIDRLQARAEAAEARADRAEEDVLDRLFREANFESGNLTGKERDEAWYASYWLQRKGGLFEADRRRARTILKETPLPPSSSPEDQEKAKAAATLSIADPDGEASNG